ncbi:hypothetical protein K8640_23770 [Myxococcus sp. XM-1-1-1]|uniref:hypothetical protein n=1 Tax=Myxococcus sp. XM-1-1-1 TaxID=2874602 RepID=UPI001CBC8CC2|nr:hypothetical protein [Myxococcus sp. XM-1-1-1]MBZ4411236.1 hypothetical protein [Myxococcus sp. XM-1-1-1]
MTNISRHQDLLSYDSWNNSLFRATFSVEHNAPNAREPVTHIDTSDEFLVMVGAHGAPAAKKEQLLKRFEKVVGGELRSKSIDACVEWTFNESGLPSAYAILFYLCRVASMQDRFEVTGFYEKLRAQTGFPHRGTSKLAHTWERLQAWLAQKPGYRPLELPTYPTFAQIGTTLGLTFPRGRDAMALRELFGSQPELSLATLSFAGVRRLFYHAGTTRNFTRGFLEVFEAFEKSVDSGTAPMAELAKHPFWRAVIGAQRELEAASPEGAVGFAIYEPEEDDSQAFLVATDGVSLGKYTSVPWPNVLEEGEEVLLSDGNAAAPLREAFEGAKSCSLLSRLRRVIRTRVLPLTGASIHDPGKRFPRLLRWSHEVALSLADAVLFRGPPPLGFAPTGLKVSGLDGWQLAAPLGGASVAAPLPDAFLLRLRGGIRAGRGTWLAAMGFLPEVIVPGATAVELVDNVIATKGKDGAWRFVREPAPGDWTLRATLSDGRQLQQAVGFVSTAFAGSYGVPPERSGFVEWGGPASASEHHAYCVDVRQREVDNESWDGSIQADALQADSAFDVRSSNRVYFGFTKGMFTREQRAGFPLGVDLLDLRAGTPRMSWTEEYATPPPPEIRLVTDQKLRERWAELVNQALEQNVIPQEYVYSFARVRRPRPQADIVHVEPELRRRVFKEPRRQKDHPNTGGHSKRSSALRPLLDVLDAVAKRRKNGIPERELLELCSSSLGGGRVAAQWHLIRALCESVILTPHHSGQWSGRSYYAVKPHLRLHHASEGWIATLAGLTDAATQRRVARELENKGGVGMPALTTVNESIQMPRWQFQKSETVLSVGSQQLGLGVTRFVPRVEVVTDQFITLIQRIPPARRPNEIPRTGQLRCFDWSQGFFSRTKREHAVELWRVVRHAQADEYVLEQDEKPVASFFSRTVAILAAHAMRGESPWLSEGRDLQMRSGCYLPMPLSRVLAFSGESLPGLDNNSYFYHFASEALLRAVTARLGFATGAPR